MDGNASSNYSENFKKDLKICRKSEDFETFRKRKETKRFRRLLDSIVESVDDQSPAFLEIMDSVAKSKVLNVLEVTSDDSHRIISVNVLNASKRYKIDKMKNIIYGLDEMKKEVEGTTKAPDEPFKCNE